MKQMINKLISIFLIVILSGFAHSIFADTGHNTQKVEYLYIQTALSGALTYDMKSLTYKLELRKVDPWTTYFSIAPTREGGFIAAEKLPKLMNQEIATRCPDGLNAGLTMFESGKAVATHYSLTLKNPVYNSKTRTMFYDASIITGGKVKPLFTTLRFKKAALFIDDIDNGSGGAGF